MIDSNNLLGETVFRLVVGSSATGGSEDGEKSAKHYKNKILAISCDNRPCSQNITKIVILTARSFPYQNHVTVKLVILVDPHYTKDHTKYENEHLLKPSFTHGSCASSSSELFFSPKQSGNDNLKSFLPGIRFIATSSWSIKCPHLKKNFLQSLMQNRVTVLFALHGGMV